MNTRRASCRGARLCALLGAASLVGIAAVAPVHAAGPQTVVRDFCEADALGARLPAGRLRQIAPLVGWAFDPAWDRALLITGYRIGPTQALDDGAVSVDVDYAVVGEATALGFEPGAYLERVSFLLDTPDGTHWRIVAPMVAPHVFGHRVRTDEVVTMLKQGRGAFLPSSLLVQRLLRAAGWDVPYIPTAELLTNPTYGAVAAAAKGDLVVYLQDGEAYHVGVLEAPDRVISSTLNGGIVRTTANAFLGEVRYLRLVARAVIPPTAPAATPTAEQP